MRKILVTIICLISIILICNTTQAIPGPPPHISNPSPYCGESDVTITVKGVQTCVNITVDSGCTVNVSFLWFNWTDWPAVPAHYEMYGYYPNVAASSQLCAWDNNVSCGTEND